MTIRVPDNVIAAPWAVGVHLSDRPLALTLDFLVPEANADAEGFVSVSRVCLAPDATEAFYVELGAILQRRHEAQGNP